MCDAHRLKLSTHPALTYVAPIFQSRARIRAGLTDRHVHEPAHAVVLLPTAESKARSKIQVQHHQLTQKRQFVQLRCVQIVSRQWLPFPGMFDVKVVRRSSEQWRKPGVFRMFGVSTLRALCVGLRVLAFAGTAGLSVFSYDPGT